MSTSVTETIVEFVAERADPDVRVDAASEFVNLGLDSLVLLELATMIKRDYGVVLTEDDLYAAGSITGAATLVQRHAALQQQA